MNERINLEISRQQQNLENLEKFGLVINIQGGIQVDINAATKQVSVNPDRFVDAPLCDHNCRIDTNGEHTGNYDCPAARTLHPRLSAKTFAPVGQILEGIEIAAEGLRKFNRDFSESKSLRNYFDDFQIPTYIHPVIVKSITDYPIEINMFGGNPELHPDINTAISTLNKGGYVVNLTTTGGKFMRDKRFAEAINQSLPRIIALSADDFENPGHILELNGMSLNELKTTHRQINSKFGQQRKAAEAVYSAKLAREGEIDSQVLFNLVVHPGNLDRIEETIDTLGEAFPVAIINPFLAQSSFHNGEPIFKKENLMRLLEFVDNRIIDHTHQKSQISPRLHYWLMQRAIFNSFNDERDILSRLSGNETWKCYRAEGAGRYVQIGISQMEHDGSKTAGGHLSCFWNPDTVTTEKQVLTMEWSDVYRHLRSGMREIASTKPNPCAGCIMPRLNFDMVTMELGMDPAIKNKYIRLRKVYVGF